MTPRCYKIATLFDVSERLKEARRESGLSQEELARCAGVSRTTVAQFKTLAKSDMSVSIVGRLLEAAGYVLKLVSAEHSTTSWPSSIAGETP